MEPVAIKVLLFASLAEKYGFRERDLQIAAGTTADRVWCAATGEINMPPNTLIAVNQQYARHTTALRGGEVVAFFPPVTGG